MASATKVAFFVCVAFVCIAVAAAAARTAFPLHTWEGLGVPSRSSGRQLSQRTGGLPKTKCFWDETKNTCVISRETAIGILKEIADSDMKAMASKVVDCNYIQTADECAAKGRCEWSEDSGVCEYKLDHTNENHFQNCIGMNVVFIQMSPAFKVCKSEAPTEDVCNILSTCTWDEDLSVCEFDIWKFMTGVPALSLRDPLPKGVQELVESRSEEIASQLKAEAITDGDEMLAFKPTPFVCPIGVDVVVCVVAQLADHLTIVQKYCNSKRSGNGTCDTKEFEICSQDCLPSADTVQDVRDSQTATFLNLVKDVTSRHILKQQTECLLKDEIACNKHANCFFDTDQEVCDIKPSEVLRHLSKHPVNKQNPHCKVVQPIFNSGCMEHKEEQCAERPNCFWDVKDELCIPGPFALIRGMLEDMVGHEDLKVLAAEADEYCLEIKNKRDCV